MEVKYKRVMSLSTQTLINLSRDAMDDEITHEEFLHIMFILGCYEEAGWEDANLKKKAKNLIDGLSPYAKEQLNKAIAEGSQMYLRCWDLIDKQNRKRNAGNKGKTDTTTSNNTVDSNIPNSSTDDRPIYKTLGQKIILMPRGREELKKFGIAGEDMQEFMNSRFTYYDTNNGAFDGMFTTEEIVQDYRDYQEDLKKSYPAAPGRGR